MKLFRKTDKQLTQEEITQWLRELRGSPYNPGSSFDVTSVFRVKYNNEDTYYFAGVNVENVDHRLSTHGEEGAIAAMATALGKDAHIVEGWVMGAPKNLKHGDQDALADNKVSCCGKCRQQIAEFADPDVVLHSISLNGDHEEATIDTLLPKQFNFKQFAPELLQPTPKELNVLSCSEIENRLTRKGAVLSNEEIYAWLQSLESIDYATQTGQAVILKLQDNQYVAGVKIENAAYVSIDPIQCAIAIANVAIEKPCVQEVWTLSQKRNQDQNNTILNQFNAYVPRKNIQPLTLSAIQVLAQFAQSNEIAINMFAGTKAVTQIPLKESATLIPCFKPSENEEQKYKIKTLTM